jgi:hypothetical protein
LVGYCASLAALLVPRLFGSDRWVYLGFLSSMLSAALLVAASLHPEAHTCVEPAARWAAAGLLSALCPAALLSAALADARDTAAATAAARAPPILLSQLAPGPPVVLLRDAVVLALPFQPLCREDCPGLCVDCGARLADDPDHRHDAPIDPRWAALGNAVADPGEDRPARTRD